MKKQESKQPETLQLLFNFFVYKKIEKKRKPLFVDKQSVMVIQNDFSTEHEWTLRTSKNTTLNLPFLLVYLMILSCGIF